jgi:hypothetical protein
LQQKFYTKEEEEEEEEEEEQTGLFKSLDQSSQKWW